MRRLLLATVGVVGAAAFIAGAVPAAMAQTAGAQTPAAPGASSQMPQPAGSLPAGGATSSQATPGGTVGGTGAPGASPMQPRRQAMQHRGRRLPQADHSDGTGASGDAPPTSAYQGGAGSPYSATASNITGRDKRSDVAPRLPNPDAGGNSAEDYLRAAQRALNAGRTGAAQEALERAETRVLSRTTEPSAAGAPDQTAMVQQIGDARRALGNRDVAGAKSAVAAALSAPVPPRGPTVTTTPGGMPTPMGVPTAPRY